MDVKIYLFVLTFTLFYELIYAWSIFNPLNTIYQTVKDNSICQLTECCNSYSIKADLKDLREKLNKYVYGQHLVTNVVLNSMEDHFKQDNPQKALTLSFHGPTGIGKNYVVKFIVESLYKMGFQSKFVHSYYAQYDFPEKSRVTEYQVRLINDLKNAVTKCERQLFIFDEVDKIPSGVLDVLKPILDTHEHIENRNFRKCIFIFVSNTGGQLIINSLENLLNSGHLREELRLHHFEHLIRLGAFNEDGGFHFSDTIESNLIDHYIPFLPLNKKHVELCIVDEFHRRNYTPNKQQINEVLEYISFQGDYAATGCKRISQKVGVIIRSKEFNRKTEF